jgi:YHS domain-containing protein
MAKDPVCGMYVDESKAQYTSEVNGQKVYLCRDQCKREFDLNPQKYGY